MIKRTAQDMAALQAAAVYMPVYIREEQPKETIKPPAFQYGCFRCGHDAGVLDLGEKYFATHAYVTVKTPVGGTAWRWSWSALLAHNSPFNEGPQRHIFENMTASAKFSDKTKFFTFGATVNEVGPQHSDYTLHAPLMLSSSNMLVPHVKGRVLTPEKVVDYLHPKRISDDILFATQPVMGRGVYTILTSPPQVNGPRPNVNAKNLRFADQGVASQFLTSKTVGGVNLTAVEPFMTKKTKQQLEGIALDLEEFKQNFIPMPNDQDPDDMEGEDWE